MRTRVECRNHRGDLTRKVFVHDGGRSEQRFEYDLLGRVLTTWARAAAGNAVGSRTEYTYDTLGRRVATLHSQRGLTIFHHGENGRLAAIETPAGVVTRQYDSAGRVTADLYADGSADRMTYDEPANARAKGRLTRQTKILPGGQPGAERAFAYDRRGRVAAETVTIDGRSFAFGYRYRANGDRAEVTYPDGSVLTSAYDAAGNLERLELDGVDYATYGGHTAEGQPADVLYGNGVTTHYDYDPAGRLRHVSTHGRDAAGAPAPLMDRQYYWNRFDEIFEISDGLEPSHLQIFTYDKRGYLVQARGPYGTLVYGHDTAGNLVQKEGTTFTYAGDRPVASSNGDVFAYDERGNRVRKTTTSETIRYAYSPRDELTEVRVDDETVGVYEYDAAGARVKKTDRSGAVTLYVSPLYEVTIHPGGVEMHTRYVPGPGGRVAAITEEVAVGAASTSGVVAAGVNAPAARAGLAFDPRLIAGAMGLSLALMLLWVWVRAAARRHAALRTLVWVPTCAVYLAVTIAGCAQPGGTVVGEVGIQKVRGGELGVVVAANGLAHAEVRSTMLVGDDGGGYPVAGTHFFHLDHLGSSTLVTDALGRELALNVYKPYGELDESSSRGPDVYRSKFAGKEWDDGADLYYFEARHYDPYTGRFLQADTLAFGSDGGLATDLNRYAYAGNNPIVYTDPSGRFVLVSILVAMAIGALVNLALEGIMSGVTHQPMSWKDAGIALGIGAATGLVGFGAGAAAGGLAKAGFAIAKGSMKAIAVEGTVGGFASGFSGDLLEQAASGTHARDLNWAGAAKTGGIGAAVGGAGDPAMARAGRAVEPATRRHVAEMSRKSIMRQRMRIWDIKHATYGIEVPAAKQFDEMLAFSKQLDVNVKGALGNPAHADDYGFTVPFIIQVQTGTATPRFLRDSHAFTKLVREGRQQFIPDDED